MKVESSKRASTARGRGTYASQACNFCKLRKTKCNGVKPVCGSCDASGHECTWGSESAKRPSTKQYVESLRNRVEALKAYVALLEARLDQCHREHGELGDHPAHLHARALADDTDVGDTSDEEADLVQELCAPTKHLVLEDSDLLLHGPTSIFRFSPKAPNTTSRFPQIAENGSQRYVLLVDGADERHYNPDFDWARFLPPEVPLERREHDRVLDLLFKFFTSWCLRVVPPLFLRDMYRTLSVPRSQHPPKTSHYSPMLHNALVALASAFSDNPRIRDRKAREYFAREAKRHLEMECQKPNISVVHALSILASYHSSQGDETLGYLYFGMSARMSQVLGLSVDCSPWVKSGLITHDDMLDRNWAHWTTFSQDICWSLFVGRNFCVTLPCDESIPVPFVDSDFDQIPWHYAPSGIPPQPNNLSRTFAMSCELLIIARRVMDAVTNSLSSPGTRKEVNSELISNLDVELNTWKERLSPEVDITPSTRAMATPHKIMLHLSYWWLFIVLHRPFYRKRSAGPRSTGKEIDHIKLCNRAAENIMELLTTWRTAYPLRYAPMTLIQAASAAGTVFILSAVQATSGARVAQVQLTHAVAQVERCMQYLREIAKSWQCANIIADILRDLVRQQLTPRLDVRAITLGAKGPCTAARKPQAPAVAPSAATPASAAGPSSLGAGPGPAGFVPPSAAWAFPSPAPPDSTAWGWRGEPFVNTNPDDMTFVGFPGLDFSLQMGVGVPAAAPAQGYSPVAYEAPGASSLGPHSSPSEVDFGDFDLVPAAAGAGGADWATLQQLFG